MLKDNLHYWNVSLNNPEPLLDEYYFHDEIIINDATLLESINKIREIIALICLLWRYGKEPDEDLFDLMLNIINSVDYVYYNEYFAFWKTLDLSYTQLKELDKPFLKEVLKEATKHYCTKRYPIYANIGFTPVITQSLFDVGSSRKQGTAYKTKLKDIVTYILKDISLIDGEGYNTHSEKFLSFSRDVFMRIREEYKIKFEFGKTYQDKLPDFIIRYRNYLVVGEAKHIKEAGGHQASSITELISFISQEESDFEHVRILYVAFLDGTYFNLFMKSNTEKISKQKSDIFKTLEKYKNSFFVNTFGFKELCKDILKQTTPVV